MNSSKQILLAKLRRPIHISYISKHLVRLPMVETLDIVNEMMEEDLIEESKYGKGYYVLKSK
jgi:alpha-D-ribose 1-methylphosphonate 5-triphosphate synthase subunit PhnL